jgi:hypothetical protein
MVKNRGLDKAIFHLGRFPKFIAQRLQCSDQRVDVLDVGHFQIVSMHYFLFTFMFIACSGCGLGYALRDIANLFPEAISSQKLMLWGLNRKKHKDQLHWPGSLFGDAGACIPLESGSVDLVLTIVTIPFVEDKLKCICEMFRVLKPGGELRLCSFMSVDGYTGHRCDLEFAGVQLIGQGLQELVCLNFHIFIKWVLRISGISFYYEPKAQCIVITRSNEHQVLRMPGLTRAKDLCVHMGEGFIRSWYTWDIDTMMRFHRAGLSHVTHVHDHFEEKARAQSSDSVDYSSAIFGGPGCESLPLSAFEFNAAHSKALLLPSPQDGNSIFADIGAAHNQTVINSPICETKRLDIGSDDVSFVASGIQASKPLLPPLRSGSADPYPNEPEGLPLEGRWQSLPRWWRIEPEHLLLHRHNNTNRIQQPALANSVHLSDEDVCTRRSTISGCSRSCTISQILDGSQGALKSSIATLESGGSEQGSRQCSEVGALKTENAGIEAETCLDKCDVFVQLGKPCVLPSYLPKRLCECLCVLQSHAIAVWRHIVRAVFNPPHPPRASMLFVE